MLNLEDVMNDESLQGPELAYIVPQRDGIIALAGLSQPNRTELRVDEAEIQGVYMDII